MPNFPVLQAKLGEKVRIRIGNMAETSHPIHLHGYSFKIVGIESNSFGRHVYLLLCFTEINKLIRILVVFRYIINLSS